MFSLKVWGIKPFWAGGFIALAGILFFVSLHKAEGKKTKSANQSINVGDPKKGDAKNCLGCHGWENVGMDKSRHGQILSKREARDKGWYCNSCHKGNPHGSPLPKEEKICLDCHGDEHEVGAKTHRDEPSWWMSAHRASGLTCVDCHGVHEKEVVRETQIGGRKNLRQSVNFLCLNCHSERKNDLRHFSKHPIGEKGMLCTECHNPHGGAPGSHASLKKSGSDLCTSCHHDKEGPFFQEHGALNDALGNGCVQCHDPHSSSHPNLLKTNGRGLCLNCHSDRAVHNPGQSCYNSGCHNAVHGTDLPGIGAPLGK